jgi:hypothetical protein
MLARGVLSALALVALSVVAAPGPPSGPTYNNGIHLVVGPNCGKWNGPVSDVKRGLPDLTKFKTIVAFGVRGRTSSLFRLALIIVRRTRLPPMVSKTALPLLLLSSPGPPPRPAAARPTGSPGSRISRQTPEPRSWTTPSAAPS